MFQLLINLYEEAWLNSLNDTKNYDFSGILMTLQDIGNFINYFSGCDIMLLAPAATPQENNS